ncbi:MAG: hypothetical protein AUJ55_08325 [Proteobacteria bacterium CG1_02_64_396]|nr:MAG: hypothetical protein AUJ55_08325 [Proteobacteria bacterium CG1_02_64_396]
MPVQALLIALLTAWTVIGYGVTPVLFSTLPDPMWAGKVAGILFHALQATGLVLLALLLLARRNLGWHGPTLVMGLALLALASLQLGWLEAAMEGLKAQAEISALPKTDPLRQEFGKLHGISSALYLVQTLLIALLIWRTRHPATPGEDDGQA